MTSKYSDFTIYQTNAIIAATINNRQVYWIIDDPDVHDFLENLYTKKKDRMNPLYREELEKLLKIVQYPPPPEFPPDFESYNLPDDESDIPF